jgi:hypothetical protein
MEGELSRPITTTTTTTTINNRNQIPGMSGWKQYRHNFLGRRLTRAGVFILFVIFSPIILPLFCLCFPFICAIAVLLHLVPIKWRFQRGERDQDNAGLIVRAKEAVGLTEARAGLLERYLEDQLGLVVDASFGSVDRS